MTPLSQAARSQQTAQRAIFLLTTKRSADIVLVGYQQEGDMSDDKSDVLHGSLTLMVLRTLAALGPMHGWGLARRIEQVSNEAFSLNQGTLYPALLRMEQLGWISTRWGVSENNRRAKFYSITRRGKKQLDAEARKWERLSGVIEKFLRPGEIR